MKKKGLSATLNFNLKWAATVPVHWNLMNICSVTNGPIVFNFSIGETWVLVNMNDFSEMVLPHCAFYICHPPPRAIIIHTPVFSKRVNTAIGLSIFWRKIDRSMFKSNHHKKGQKDELQVMITWNFSNQIHTTKFILTSIIRLRIVGILGQI